MQPCSVWGASEIQPVPSSQGPFPQVYSPPRASITSVCQAEGRRDIHQEQREAAPENFHWQPIGQT